MATLESVSGASFVPDLASAFKTAVTGFREQGAREEEEARQLEIASEAGILSEPETSVARRNEALLRITALDPKLGQALTAVRQSGDKATIAKARQLAEQGLRNAKVVQSKRTFAEKRAALSEIISVKISKGQDVSRDMEIFNFGTEDELDNEMERRVIVGTDIETLTAPIAPPKLTKAKPGDVFVDPTGTVVSTIPLTPGATGVDFAKPAVKDFTPESVEVAENPGGSLSDLIIRPEVLRKINEDGRFATGTSVLFKNKAGKLFIATPVTSKDEEGKPVTKTNVVPLTTPTGEEGQVVSREFGETPEQKQARLVETAGQVTRAQRLALIDTQADLTGVQKRTERDFVNIESAVSAAENIPRLKQNLELLKKIDTGGIDAIVLATARVLGVESGNQAELTFNLRTNVLKQLKPTFGAQFTEREGKLLAEIQASETKSTAGNIRLMKRAIEIYNRAIARGKRAAKRQGDESAIEDINAFLEPLEVLTEGTPSAISPTAPAPQGGGLTTEQKNRLEQLRKKQR